MARELTNPEPNPDTHSQSLCELKFRFIDDIDENGDPSMNRDISYLEFEVIHRSEDGSKLKVERHRENVSAWPQALRDEMKAVYSRIEAYAESLGMMAPGTSEEL